MTRPDHIKRLSDSIGPAINDFADTIGTRHGEKARIVFRIMTDAAFDCRVLASVVATIGNSLNGHCQNHGAAVRFMAELHEKHAMQLLGSLVTNAQKQYGLSDAVIEDIAGFTSKCVDRLDTLEREFGTYLNKEMNDGHEKGSTDDQG